MEIKVSVIIPVYNAAPWIGTCLDSIFRQNMESIEIICVDDGSSDASVQIISEYQSASNLSLIHNEHAGAGHARNTGLKKANGKYVMFVDADDYLADVDVLNKLYSKAIAGQHNICGGSAAVFDGKCVTVPSKYSFPAESVLDFRNNQFIYGFWRFLFRKEYLLSEGISFPTYKVFEDPVFLLKAFSQSEAFAVIPDTVYVHRKNHKKRNTVYEYAVDELAAYNDILNISILRDYAIITQEMEEKKKSLSRWLQNYRTNEFYQTENRCKVKSSFVWLADIIEKNNSIHEGISLCDVGCAAGDFLLYMKGRFQINQLTGIDCNDKVLESAHRNCPISKLICADISDENFNEKHNTDLPEKFDLVTFMGTLYLFEDFRLPVQNLLSLVKDNGVTYIFGNFNQYGIDVAYKYYYEIDGVRYCGEDFSHSIASFSKWAVQNGYSVKCYEFSLPVKIEKTDNPLRVWTQSLEDGSYLQRDGLNRVKEQFLLEIRKTGSAKNLG